uniref:Uncharacterized protein n=1 Tax=Angiostrongylus cantonensis TaxID=6313 RepID=A0A0K0D4D7_ANGCA
MNRSRWSVSVSAYLKETPPIDEVTTTPLADAVTSTARATVATTVTGTSTTATAAMSLAKHMLNAMTTAVTMTSSIPESDDDIRVIVLNNTGQQGVSIEKWVAGCLILVRCALL